MNSNSDTKKKEKLPTIVLWALVALLLIFYLGCQDGWEDDSTSTSSDVQEAEKVVNDVVMSRRVNLDPVWKNAGMQVALESDSKVFKLLWDQSIPIGGYVHRTDPDSQFTLYRIQELLLNARLTSDYGARGTIPECMGITDTLATIKCDRSLLRDFFDGSGSRVDEGVRHVIQGLKSGSIMGAALITDLMTTTEYGIGATALLPYFNDPELRGYFSGSKIHMALVGIRIPYWGVNITQECRELSGSLGCWFHEGQERYQSLEKVVKRPLYVLIIGRSIGEGNPVHTIATKFQESIRELGFDVESEFLTQSQTYFDWRNIQTEDNSRPPLDLDTEKGFECNVREPHPVRGSFRDSSITINKIEIAEDSTLFRDFAPPASQIRQNGQRGIELIVSCRSVRRILREEHEIKEEEKKKCNDGMIKSNYEVTANLDRSKTDVWSDWSSIKHSSSKTLYLTEFIDELRPDSYKATLSLVPPLQCEG